MTYVLNTLHAISTHTSTSRARTIVIVIIFTIIILSLLNRHLGLKNLRPDDRLFTMPCDRLMNKPVIYRDCSDHTRSLITNPDANCPAGQSANIDKD